MQCLSTRFLTIFAKNFMSFRALSLPLGRRSMPENSTPPSQRQQPRITKMFCCVYNFSQHVGRKYLCQSANCINQIYSIFTIGYIWTQKDLVRAPNREIENNANVCHKTSNWRFLHAPSHSMTNSTQTRNHKGIPACRVEKYRRINSWHWNCF